LYGDGRSYLVDDGIFVFNTRYGFVVEEVAYIFINIFLVPTCITFVVVRFHIAQIFGTGTLVFAFSEAKLAGTFHFADQGGDTVFHCIFFAYNDAGKGLFGFCNEEISIIGSCVDIWRVGSLKQFVQSGIQHVIDEVDGIVLYQIIHIAFF